jgi:hypothetical protein
VRPAEGDHIEVDARYEGREQHGEAATLDAIRMLVEAEV